MWLHSRTRSVVVAVSMILAGGSTAWLCLRPPIPRYQLLIEGGRAAYLAPSQVPLLDVDSRLSITLRPELASTRYVFVYALVKEQSRQVAWPILFERSRHGTLRLQGTLRELRLPCQRQCTITFYLSGFAVLPAIMRLVPGDQLQRFFPLSQTLQAEVLVDVPAADPQDPAVLD